MSKSDCSLFDALSPNVPIAFWKGEYIYPDKFKYHVFALAESIPDKKYAINLCEDRYLFLVAFAACLLRSQPSLLPSSRAVKEVERISKLYPDSYCIVDCKTSHSFSDQFVVQLDDAGCVSRPDCNHDHNAIAVVAFTSGSTGVPRAHPKRWKDLVASSIELSHSLELENAGFNTIVATVPPQHMYGLELSIIYPLVNGACVHAGRPFFPQDIKSAIQEVAAPRVLVTTPIHLRACSEAIRDWPELKSVISAASKLSEDDAEEAEAVLSTKVLEVYGCTEVGAIATRRTTKDKEWRLLKGYQITVMQEGVYLKIQGKDEVIPLPDIVDMVGVGKFHLVGRDSDIVKIGGKRASLSGITNTLKSISGVKDGVVFNPDRSGVGRSRLAAIVVAPEMTESKILFELSKFIDQVFIPRRIIKVDSLPYSETGKLRLGAINKLIDQNTNIDDQ